MHFCVGKKRFGIGLTALLILWIKLESLASLLAAILLLLTFLLKYFLYLISLLIISRLNVTFADFSFFSVINSFAAKLKKKDDAANF
ncbi:hypothetical protein GGTG_07945 [Gaeumannomyces tritici R3-111a-1]|uniref:Uncharacterized protein n=1 Tax=Gaeumannomyces tritici (strain R3-111a-1) TaxID=644352 RepID=J3P355_GAET3|nr:hypothetical protein GGTG_07945 [Gaeumannomyces tritici R3-111a-1]EJT74097.1 hypothetical protein GGTG_07945 [Gaeumannomyces tritici R3-111a-1]